MHFATTYHMNLLESVISDDSWLRYCLNDRTVRKAKSSIMILNFGPTQKEDKWHSS